MFGSLGVPELIFIFALALLIFGPRKLPEIGRTIGRGLSEFRKASTDLKRSINAEMIEEEIRESDPRKILRDDADEAPAVEAAEAVADGDGGESPSAGDEAPVETASVETAPDATSPDVTASSAASPAGSIPRSADS